MASPTESEPRLTLEPEMEERSMPEALMEAMEAKPSPEVAFLTENEMLAPWARLRPLASLPRPVRSMAGDGPSERTEARLA